MAQALDAKRLLKGEYSNQRKDFCIDSNRKERISLRLRVLI